MHYTLKMEADCGQYRCEIARGTASLERQAEIGAWIARYSHTLAHVASGTCLPDDRKRRVLNTFMTLMILRENLDRAAHRTPPIVESCT